MPSMRAMHALSEVSLRSSTVAKVPLPFTRHSMRVRFFGTVSAPCDLPHYGPQGPREVFRKVVRVFEPDREPQQVLGGGGTRSLYGRPVLDVAVRPPLRANFPESRLRDVGYQEARRAEAIQASAQPDANAMLTLLAQ
jgi:hypothetical protein